MFFRGALRDAVRVRLWRAVPESEQSKASDEILADLGALGAVAVEVALATRSGWGRSHVPLRDDAAVAIQFGETLAGELLAYLSQIEGEFAAIANSMPGHRPFSSQRSGEAFRARHPELPANVARILTWMDVSEHRARPLVVHDGGGGEVLRNDVGDVL